MHFTGTQLILELWRYADISGPVWCRGRSRAGLGPPRCGQPAEEPQAKVYRVMTTLLTVDDSRKSLGV
jgi:hypothetical protein